MNKTARHALRLCIAARNLRRIPCCTAWACYSRTAMLPYSSNSNTNSKDSGSLLTPVTSNGATDAIIQYLHEAETANDIFEIVKEYSPSFKSQHSIQAFKRLDNIYKLKNMTDISIKDRMEFLKLCELLHNNIKFMDSNTAVYILKGLTNFGVSPKSVLAQSLLQVIRSSLSHLSFHNLVVLNFQLKDFPSTPLTDALKIAVPLMCEIRLNSKMIDTSDTGQLCDVLLFLCIKPAKDNTNISERNKSTEMVINALKTIGQDMNIRYASKILRYLCDLKYLPPGYQKVLYNVQQILINNMSQLTFYNIQSSLGKIVKKVYFHNDKTFYNEEFVDACAKVIVSEDFGFAEGVRILQLLYTIGHTQIRLIDYLAAKCFENPEVLNTSPPATNMILIMSLAMTDYKPIFWESMQDTVLKNLAANQYPCKPILIDFAISMAVLDCYDPRIIKLVFTEHFLHLLMKADKRQGYWNLLLLYQSIKLLYPKYNELWPPKYVLATAINVNGPYVANSSLLPALEKAMGGPQYILSNLKSKLGHHIDHVVVMRKGGYPIAVNSFSEARGDEESIRHIEDIQLPVESQVIIVSNLPASAYSINSNRLKGKWTLLLKTLELQTRHTVIPISSVMWNALMEHERIPYLMQAIRLKCDSLSASANV